MKTVEALLYDIETFAERATEPQRVLMLLDEARRFLEEGDLLMAKDSALAAAFILASDPTYAWGDSDVAWLLRCAVITLPPVEVLDEARCLLEEAASRYRGQRDAWGELLPEWEHYNAAASRAWRLQRYAAGDEEPGSAIALHRDLDEVIDALLSLLVIEEERVRREQIVDIVSVLRMHTK